MSCRMYIVCRRTISVNNQLVIELGLPEIRVTKGLEKVKLLKMTWAAILGCSVFEFKNYHDYEVWIYQNGSNKLDKLLLKLAENVSAFREMGPLNEEDICTMYIAPDKSCSWSSCYVWSDYPRLFFIEKNLIKQVHFYILCIIGPWNQEYLIYNNIGILFYMFPLVLWYLL